MATPRLKEKYLRKSYRPEREIQYKSIMQVPKIEKICINKGIGAAVADKKLIDVVLRKSLPSPVKGGADKIKKDISNFKLRKTRLLVCGLPCWRPHVWISGPFDERSASRVRDFKA